MNFIDAFLQYCGESECPQPYLQWAALSLLAASCGNRIFLPYRIGHQPIRIYPNLYVLLIGPSGNFKSYAISRVQEILNGVDYTTTLNLYSGHVTASGMYDAMRPIRRVRNPETKRLETIESPWNSQFYLLNDELANDVGSVEYADLFIRALTKLYYLSPFDDRTRTSGHVHLEGYSLNWFAGTTVEWLILAITRHTLLSGFFGRTVTVNCGYSDTRVYPYDAKRPANWDTLYNFLTARAIELLNIEGPKAIKLTKDALRIDRAWYMMRDTPQRDDPTMQSSQRQHDLSLKLALLLTLAANESEVSSDALVAAQEMTREVVQWQRQVLPKIQKGSTVSASDKLLRLVLSGDGTPHKKLAKLAYDSFGMKAFELSGIVQTWIDSGYVTDEKGIYRPKGAVADVRKTVED